MWIVILVIIGIVAGLGLKIHSLDFMNKLAVKIVLVYLVLGWVFLCACLVVFSAQELYESGYAGGETAPGGTVSGGG